MNIKDGFDGFQLDGYLLEHDEIRRMRSYVQALIRHRNSRRRFEFNTAELELMFQRLLIDGLTEARPQNSMNFDRSADDGPGDFVEFFRVLQSFLLFVIFV